MIIIGEKGLLSQEPLRRQFDGITYFGCKKSIGPSKEVSGTSSVEGSVSLIEESTGGINKPLLHRK